MGEVTETYETVIIGGGQAGLAVGYHLARLGRPFVILEGGARVGEAWRSRWRSLRLFSPARYDGLPGWRFPAPAWSFPSKDEMADYLEAYAERFELPVVTGVRVDGLAKDGDGFLVTAGERRFAAAAVVVATGAHRTPRTPALAAELDPRIHQLHSRDYRDPVRAARRPGAGRRGGQLRRRDRARAGADAARLAGGAGRRRDPGAAREPALAAVPPGHPLPRPPGADGPHAGRPAGRPRPRPRRDAADPHEDRGARRGRRRAGAARRGHAGRPPGARGRAGAGARRRRLVHRLPPGLLLDRPAGARRRRAAGPRPRRGARGAAASPSSACRSSTR